MHTHTQTPTHLSFTPHLSGVRLSSLLNLLSCLFTTDKYIFPCVVPITQLLDALIDTWKQIDVCVCALCVHVQCVSAG